MSEGWITILGLALTTVIVRASGPLVVRGRPLPPQLAGVIEMLGPAVLTALIVVELFSDDGEIVVGAAVAGVLAAGVVLLRRQSALLTAIIVAAAVTAALRALG